MIQLAKHPILVDSSVFDHTLKIFLQICQIKLLLVCDLDKAKVFVTLNNMGWLAILEKGSIWKYKGASLELIWVGWYQVLHEPSE